MNFLVIVDVGSEAPEADYLQRILADARSVDTVDHPLEVDGFFVFAIRGRGDGDLAHGAVRVARVVAGDAAVEIIGPVAAVQAE